MGKTNWKELLKGTFGEFANERPFLHGAALSYYALMALVPMLYLSITIFGNFVGKETMHDIMISLLQDQVGIQEPEGIVSFLDQVHVGEGSLFLQVAGILALMFSCTAILNSLKKSINDFYGLKRNQMGRKRRIIRSVLFRLLSMVFILGATVVVMLLYFAETVFLSLGNKWLGSVEWLDWFVSYIIIHGVPVLMNVILFSFVFKYVNDARVKWKVAIRGAIATGLLLYLGQLLIKYYLSNYFFAADGGVAGTMLVILVWVYYSSQILFLGAKFTAVYARLKGEPIVYRD